MELSIIIPAYNVEEFIESCIESCCMQDVNPKDYEIIVVNDGSTDNTEKIVLNLSRKYSNIKLKSQKNKGNGAARNVGVSISNGDIIFFLDADDYIAKNTLGTLIRLLKQNNLDIIGFSSKKVTDSNLINSQHSNTEIKINTIYRGIDFLGANTYRPEVWWYLIKKSFYIESESFFYDKKFLQDSYFTTTLISKAQKIAYVNYDVYRYRLSENSITRNKAFDHVKTHLEDMYFAVHKLYDLKKDLIKKGVTNHMTLQKLHIKQQYYVFIIIIRFIKKSNLKTLQLKKMLTAFKAIEAYPLDKFMSNPDNTNKFYKALTFIFNREYLLYTSVKLYRVITSYKFLFKNHNYLNYKRF